MWSGALVLPGALPVWMAATAVGALLGGHIGSRRLDAARLQQVLAIVLVIAGVKLTLGL